MGKSVFCCYEQQVVVFAVNCFRMAFCHFRVWGSRQIDLHAINSDGPEELEQATGFAELEYDSGKIEDLIVTIDRKRAVHGSFVAFCVLSLVVFAGTFTLFGAKAFRSLDGFMMLFLGVAIACVCAIIALWIRARWICVAVLDESGIIASTMESKHELLWKDIIGARTYTKVLKDAKKIQVRLLLLLEDSRCLESPVDQAQMNRLFRILFAAEFKNRSEGQKMGTLKGFTLVFIGAAALILGTWWSGHVVDQFNKGVFFQGNAKVIIFKIAFAFAGPVGGLGCIGWGLYHAIVQPIFYKPGYLSRHGK